MAATAGTAEFLNSNGVHVETVVAKLSEEGREISAGVDAVELIGAGQVKLVVNTPRGRGPLPGADSSPGPSLAGRHFVRYLQL